MALTDIIRTLRTDLADPGAESFTDEVLKRCILKSIFPVGRDLGAQMSIVDAEITPEPNGEILEILLLQAQIEACRFMRAKTANTFSFTSGDKKVDKTSQPEQWAKLENDLMARYKERLREMKPDAVIADYIITPQPLRPVIFEQGRHHHDHTH